MGVVWRAAIDSPGYLYKAESRLCGSAVLAVHPTKSLCVTACNARGSSQCSETSLFSSSPRWRLRFCGGAADSRYVGGVDPRIRRWATVCHVCGAESRMANKRPHTESNLLLPRSKN